jgi:hypothetical protein
MLNNQRINDFYNMHLFQKPEILSLPNALLNAKMEARGNRSVAKAIGEACGAVVVHTGLSKSPVFHPIENIFGYESKPKGIRMQP